MVVAVVLVFCVMLAVFSAVGLIYSVSVIPTDVKPALSLNTKVLLDDIPT